MGCAGSKPSTKVDRDPSRKYLNNAARFDNIGGAAMYLPQTGPLTAKEYKERLTTSDGTQTVQLPQSNYSIRYAYVSQRGYYPDNPDKLNQDAFCVHTFFGGDPEQHFFGVFDGHGEFGTACAQFARDKVPENFLFDPNFASNPELAFHNAHVTTNAQCHRADFDDQMSGTTSINALVRGRMLYIANVGDSRAVLAERVGGRIMAQDLSIDQTPYRRDECERVRAAGARVQTLDQMEGLKDPGIECWTTEEEDGGDPPRLWFQNGMYPGTAFTRSIGDAAAERIGVFAEPELEVRPLTGQSCFLIIASDGVFEFLSSQSVVDMVSKFDDPHEAALSVVAESYRLWLQFETRTDDITMIVLQFVGLENPPRHAMVEKAAIGHAPGADGVLAVSEELAAAPSYRERLGISVRVMDVECSPHSDEWIREGTSPTILPATSTAKSEADLTVLEESVRNHFLFTHLSEEQRRRVFDAMEVVHVKAGTEVIHQGQRGDHFYIVKTGTYDVLMTIPDTGRQELIHTYRVESGAARPSFGELALLYGKPRAASVIAQTEGVLWRLHRRDFRAALQAQHADLAPIVRSLRSCELLRPLTGSQLQLLVLLMRRQRYEDGTPIFRQGDQAEAMYVVVSGQVVSSVMRVNSSTGSITNSKDVLVVGPGQYIVEKALMGPYPLQASATARGPVELLSISRRAFEEHFGPLAALAEAHAAWKRWLDRQRGLLLERNILGSGKAADMLEGKFEPHALHCDSALWATDYSCLAEMRHEHDTTIRTLGRLFSISAVEMAGCGPSVARQRSITRTLPPFLFVPHTLISWVDPQRRYAAEAVATIAICTLETMLLHRGAAAAAATQAEGAAEAGPGALPEASAQYVAACVVLALEHLHYLGIAFRGLSASSIVLTEGGLVQLVDFRFARRCEGHAYTLCGNPEYMAPEQVESTGHTDAVDWWALGVLIYTMLTGHSPFAGPGDDELRIYKRISKGHVSYPADMSTDARDIVGQLLARDPSQRLGAAMGGVPRLRAHPWFGSIDWEQLRQGHAPLPIGIRESLFSAAAAEGGAWEAPPAPGLQPEWLAEF